MILSLTYTANYTQVLITRKLCQRGLKVLPWHEHLQVKMAKSQGKSEMFLPSTGQNSFFQQFFEATQGMNPTARGAFLEEPPEGAPDIEEVHHVSQIALLPLPETRVNLKTLSIMQVTFIW